MERSEEATQQARELAAEAEQLQARFASTRRPLVCASYRRHTDVCALAC